ncbi:helix-turn-helix domain-containing GNAT family N-acetyltransferase [Mesorhizobium sp. LHD-90]|uniref:helix-turn-helix domain-containing GNAT family N-acetyltransferase n=1 Tax=Mesorhizobium sp. LHD-90 TaxID=3071414 RepID=UPI0027DFF4E8|nr:helix-turn-helix domain-containing GNAT family N-acetyltransferase [Mesorhizobium sp. LHD-90]MDQ6433685.1 helix-turn-helix domain-containing GNAT family N-acetyltransferase [Mesorhizobium sp. LHD-90]
MQDGQIEQIRRFNRLVSQRIGALDDSYLSRGRPLGEARLIFETGQGEGRDVRFLRRRLGLDAGYLSRLLRSLEGQQLVEVGRAEADGRVRQARLTAKGRDEYAAYDALSDEMARAMLASLGEAQRERLVAAMAEVERLLRIAALEVSVEAPDSDEARFCLGEYFAELARRFEEGFDLELGKAAEASEMMPPKGWFVMARIDGEPAGCGVLKTLEEGIGEIKRVWVSPSARGLGIASRLMEKLESIALEAGLTTVRLDTNRALSEAQAMYRKLGYHEIERYNDNFYANHWFEKRL